MKATDQSAKRPPKLSVQSHWLLRFLAERGLMSRSVGMPVHWSQQPGMVNMRGLIRRGWAEEKQNGLFAITPAGRTAAEQVGPCPAVKDSLRGH